MFSGVNEIAALLFEDESATLDFKREQYKFSNATEYQKAELLKDILAFANAWRRTDAFILLGVEEVKGGRSIPVGITEDLEDSQLQQFVNSKTQKPISFSYSAVVIDGGIKIGVIRIPLQERPFYLKDDYGRLRKNIMYIRRGSSTDQATPDEIINDVASSRLSQVRLIPNVNFNFSFGVNGEIKDDRLDLNFIKFDRGNIKDIPDYSVDKSTDIIGSTYVNQNFLREAFEYYCQLASIKAFSFSIENVADFPLRDVNVKISIKKQNGVSFKRQASLPDFPETKHNIRFISPPMFKVGEVGYEIDEFEEDIIINIPFDKIRPKEEKVFPKKLYLNSVFNGEITFNVKVFSDDIANPIEKKLTLNCVTEHSNADWKEVFHYFKGKGLDRCFTST